MEQSYVTVQGLRVDCLRAGEGTPLVLVHGLAASKVAWSRNIQALAARHRVYALDLPGHGDSVKPDIEYTVPAGARFLVDFLDVVGLERAAFIGNSMGGLLALRVAMEHPERVTHLVLVDAAGLGREVAWFLRFMSLPLLGEVVQRLRPRSTDLLARSIFYQPRLVEPWVLAELERARGTPEALRAGLRAVRSGVELRGLKNSLVGVSRLRDLPMPVLVVWGAEDRVFPVRHAHAVARSAPNVRVEVFPRCGHWPHMENAERFNALVLEFLSMPGAPREGADL